MSTAILDARQWRQAVDLKTGHPIPLRGEKAAMVSRIMADRPFPGDRDPMANAWVTDVALDLVAAYDPGFVFLAFARQYYSARFSPLEPGERADMIEDAFAQAERFAAASGYFTVIVGGPGMTGAVGSFDVTGLDGLAISANWSTRYTGLYAPSSADLTALANDEGVERLATRQEIVELFGGGHGDGARLPDVMVVSRKGYHPNIASLRRLIMLPDPDRLMPVSENLGRIETITGIKDRLLDHLAGRKVAVAYLESVGRQDFTRPFATCANGRDWYTYEPGDNHYLALTTGRHPVFEHNGGYRYYKDDVEARPFPFSGYFDRMPEGTIGQEYPGRSVAVGNRSMFMHTATGCDICVECFARNLYNQGLMAVVHREDK